MTGQEMSRAKRFSRRWTIQLAFAIALGAATVACVLVSGDVVGRPAAGAYIAYYYSGTRFTFPHPVTATRPGAIARSGADRPPLLTVKPRLDSSARSWIELVYAPQLDGAALSHGPAGARSTCTPSYVIPGRSDR